MSAFVWCIMNQLCEMVTYVPLSGQATTFALADRYGSKALGFAAGYNLYYAQLIGPAAEITACALIIEYWQPNAKYVPLWISICFAVVSAINFAPVKYFGEVKFNIASLKIICIVGLIIMGICFFFGAAPNQHGVLGFHNWKHGQAFAEYLVPGSTGRFLSVWTAIIKSGFSYILSPELITSCAAEAEYPRTNLPKACRRFIYRLIFFYILGSLVIGVICSHTDPALITAIDAGQSGAAASPYVVAIHNMGVKGLNHVINAVILTSAFSSANAGVYACSRTGHSMSLRGVAPKALSKTNKQGVPIYTVLISIAFLALAYLNVSSTASQVFTWLSNICTISGFISWIIVSMTYIRFRRAISYNNLDDRVPFRMRGQYYGAYACIGFFTLLTLTNGYAVFFPENWSAQDFVAAYITLPVVVVLFFGYMLYDKKLQFFYPIEEVDVYRGLEETKKLERDEVPLEPRNIVERVWGFIC